MTTRLLPLALLVLAAVPAAAQPPAPREEPKPPTVPADGTEVFQFLLDKAKLKPIPKEERSRLFQWEDVVVIVLGRTNEAVGLPAMPLDLAARSIQGGGAALIASDAPTWFSSFQHGRDFNVGDVRIPDGFVASGIQTRRESLFRSQPNMPFVVPLDPPGDRPPAREWAILHGLERIATNRPAFLRVPNPRGEFGSLLASYPTDCRWYDGELRAGGGINQKQHFFAVGSSGMEVPLHRKYRFLALADPSVFINQMMLASDENGNVDNIEFAARAVSFLVEKEGGGRRTRAILIQNGEVVENYDSLRRMIQPPLPLPNFDKKTLQEKLTDLGNKIIDDFEEKDRANKMLLGDNEEKRDHSFRNVMKVAIALLLIRAIWYLLKRTTSAKRPADGPPPPGGGLPPAPPDQKPRGLFDRRQKELFRRNNLYEPVRVVVRDMFLAAGAPQNPGKRLPEVEISDVVTRPDTLVDALTDLWKIAYGPPRVVTVQRWQQLEPLFERVRQAHADQKWRFVTF